MLRVDLVSLTYELFNLLVPYVLQMCHCAMTVIVLLPFTYIIVGVTDSNSRHRDPQSPRVGVMSF